MNTGVLDMTESYESQECSTVDQAKRLIELIAVAEMMDTVSAWVSELPPVFSRRFSDCTLLSDPDHAMRSKMYTPDEYAVAEEAGRLPIGWVRVDSGDAEYEIKVSYYGEEPDKSDLSVAASINITRIATNATTFHNIVSEFEYNIWTDFNDQYFIHPEDADNSVAPNRSEYSKLGALKHEEEMEAARLQAGINDLEAIANDEPTTADIARRLFREWKNSEAGINEDQVQPSESRWFQSLFAPTDADIAYSMEQQRRYVHEMLVERSEGIGLVTYDEAEALATVIKGLVK